jgi:hypothetical protein
MGLLRRASLNTKHRGHLSATISEQTRAPGLRQVSSSRSRSFFPRTITEKLRAGRKQEKKKLGDVHRCLEGVYVKRWLIELAWSPPVPCPAYAIVAASRNGNSETPTNKAA